MDAIRRRVPQILQLEDIPIDQRIAKRLPPRLAFGYHVLPLAVERNRITVAMADPGNELAIEAVKSALGMKPTIVKSDQAWIDSLLVELWPEYQYDDLRLRLCSFSNRPSIKLRNYSKYICDILSIPPCNADTIVGIARAPSKPIEETMGKVDLLILEDSPVRKVGGSSLQRPGFRRILKLCKPSVLIAREPQWPIEKVLLVLSCDNLDYVMLDWILKFSLASQAEVTLLVSLPPVPKMYQGLDEMSLQIPEILQGQSTLGKHLKGLVGKLETCGVNVKLKIDEGDPKWVIKNEVSVEDYDLIVVTAESSSWLRRILLSSLVERVLEFADKPILMARPIITKIKSVTESSCTES
jgi:nucleotide-binding universal stress UspA family protein